MTSTANVKQHKSGKGKKRTATSLKRSDGKGEPSASMAQRADRHQLYELSVQDVESEVEFIDATFESLRGRKPDFIREDFCGTAQLCKAWVERRAANRAIGVDLDPEVLRWAQGHNLASLDAETKNRLTIVQDDVLRVKTELVDVVLAFNFSYWLFKKRSMMRAYFESVRRSLNPSGVFFLDCYGGYEAFEVLEEEREVNDDFNYVWDQVDYDPVSGDLQCDIHFRFRDGSELKSAYSYHWRLWTLPEIREILDEAGFSRMRIFWEGADEETCEGNGEFAEVTRGEADPGWICYIVAEP